jgi:hypothetical protein
VRARTPRLDRGGSLATGSHKLLLLTKATLDGACNLHERAAAIREVRLGADHHMTAWSLSGLVNVLLTRT